MCVKKCRKLSAPPFLCFGVYAYRALMTYKLMVSGGCMAIGASGLSGTKVLGSWKATAKDLFGGDASVAASASCHKAACFSARYRFTAA